MPATLTYNKISINNKDIALGGSCRASFNDPYNKIVVTFTTDKALDTWMARVTKAEDDYDVDLGTIAVQNSSVIKSGSTCTFNIDINVTNFSYGDIDYRISMYSKCQEDGLWDVTYLFITSDGNVFCTSDGGNFEVVSNKSTN